MINLKYTYQPSKNLDEVNKQVTNLVELLKNELLQAATNENVESLVMKVEQTSDDGAKRLAEVNARVGDTAAIVGMMASYNSATGKITVEAGLKAGIEESNIVLSGDHIILDGDVTIRSGNNGFMLDGGHIVANSITATQIDVTTLSVQSLVNAYGNYVVFGNGIKIPDNSGNYTTVDAYGLNTSYAIINQILTSKLDNMSQYDMRITSVHGLNMSVTSGNEIHLSGGITRIYDGLKVSDHLESFGTTYLNGTVYSHGINQQSLQSGVANVRIALDSDLMMAITGSSRRFKHDIKPLEEDLDPHKLYDIPVIQYIYNEDYIDKNDQRSGIPIPGFIAEDFLEHYPIACDVGKNGEAETWNERIVIPPMLALIQEQNQRIKRLEEAYVRNN